MIHVIALITCLVAASILFFTYVVVRKFKVVQEQSEQIACNSKKMASLSIQSQRRASMSLSKAIEAGAPCKVCVMGRYEPADLSCSLCGHSVEIGVDDE